MTIDSILKLLGGAFLFTCLQRIEQQVRANRELLRQGNDEPIRNLITGLGGWRTMFPRLTSDTVVKIFLDRGATVWVLRTNQIGGCDRAIEPIAPMTI
jgi:predicted Abi (CAAX) family protease